MELHCVTGAKKPFNFLHLTIQEFLAAYHIFSVKDQIKWFRDHTIFRNCFPSTNYMKKAVLNQFLAGLSREAFKAVIEDRSSSRLNFRADMICRFFEAKLGLSDRHVTVDYGAHTYVMYMLGSIIANSSDTCHWDVHINDNAMQMFVRGISNKNIQSKLTLHIHINMDESLNPSLSQLNCTLEHLHLNSKSNDLTVNDYTPDKPFSDIIILIQRQWTLYQTLTVDFLCI